MWVMGWSLSAHGTCTQNACSRPVAVNAVSASLPTPSVNDDIYLNLKYPEGLAAIVKTLFILKFSLKSYVSSKDIFCNKLHISTYKRLTQNVSWFCYCCWYRDYTTVLS